jgi:hypothetical protein
MHSRWLAVILVLFTHAGLLGCESGSADDENTCKSDYSCGFGDICWDGYFISPIDAIPDFTPVIGYSDDFAVLSLAVVTVAAHIKKIHGKMARKKLKAWFN